MQYMNRIPTTDSHQWYKAFQNKILWLQTLWFIFLRLPKMLPITFTIHHWIVLVESSLFYSHIKKHRNIQNNILYLTACACKWCLYNSSWVQIHALLTLLYGYIKVWLQQFFFIVFNSSQMWLVLYCVFLITLRFKFW